MPRVSVIVAARDAARHLPEALDSVFAQTFADWEVVLVDDASGDETRALALAYGDRVRVLANDRPAGPAAARNAAIGHAHGDLVAVLDADDLWTAEYLSEQVALYERVRAEGRPVGVVCCNAAILENGVEAPDTFADRTAWPRSESIGIHELLAVNLVYTSVLMPRALALELGGYAPELRRAEDYDLWLRVAEGGHEIIWNPRPLALYRMHDGGLTASTAKAMAATADVYGRSLRRGRLDRRGRSIARRRRIFYRFKALTAR